MKNVFIVHSSKLCMLHRAFHFNIRQIFYSWSLESLTFPHLCITDSCYFSFDCTRSESKYTKMLVTSLEGELLLWDVYLETLSSLAPHRNPETPYVIDVDFAFNISIQLSNWLATFLTINLTWFVKVASLVPDGTILDVPSIKGGESLICVYR